MSDAFIAGRTMPDRFIRAGENRSPSLVWTNIPLQTQELAIIMSDPDAPRGQFTHWVVYKIPATYRYLEAGLPQQAQLPSGILQGRNDFGRTGYDGPAPPAGDKPHRYVFRLYALDTPLNLKPGVSAEELRAAMAGHILDVGETVGIYGR
jgi:Raf kinase inhibitor-like YbhB/YbcL family protein